MSAKSKQVKAQVPKIFLNVSFAEKDVVKGLGAWFDPTSKSWYIPPHKVADKANFAKWIVQQQLPTTTPAAKGAKVPVVGVTPAAMANGSDKKRPFAMVTPSLGSGGPVAAAGEDAEPAPIPSYLLYKLKEWSTADLAKVLLGLGVKLEIGLDAEELIAVMQARPELIHIDTTPPPPVVFKAPKQLSEHELIMQRLKAEARAKKVAEEASKVIVPEITRGPAKPKKAKTEGSSQPFSSSPPENAVPVTADASDIFDDPFED